MESRRYPQRLICIYLISKQPFSRRSPGCTVRRQYEAQGRHVRTRAEFIPGGRNRRRDFQVLRGIEALSNIKDVAASDETMSDVEKAALLAGLGNVIDKLRRAEKGAGAKVLSTPNDARVARLQSLIASGDVRRAGDPFLNAKHAMSALSM